MTILSEDIDFHRLSVGDTLTIRTSPLGLDDTGDKEAVVLNTRRNSPINADGEYELKAELKDEDGERHEVTRWVTPEGFPEWAHTDPRDHDVTEM